METNKRLTEILNKGRHYATATSAEVYLEDLSGEFYASVEYNEQMEPSNLQVTMDGEEMELSDEEREFVENYLFELSKKEIEDKYNDDACAYNYENTGTNELMFV